MTQQARLGLQEDRGEQAGPMGGGDIAMAQQVVGHEDSQPANIIDNLIRQDGAHKAKGRKHSVKLTVALGLHHDLKQG